MKKTVKQKAQLALTETQKLREQYNIERVKMQEKMNCLDKEIERSHEWIDLIRLYCGVLAGIVILISLSYDFWASVFLLQHNKGFSLFQFAGVIFGGLLLTVAIRRHRE